MQGLNVMQRNQSLFGITEGMASRSRVKQIDETKQLPAKVCELK